MKLNMKSCSRCKNEFPVTEFYRRSVRSKKTGEWLLSSWCIPCTKGYQGIAGFTPAAVAAEHRRQRRTLKRTSAYWKHVETTYGLSKGDISVLSQYQNSVCAICEVVFDTLEKGFVIDHDHTSNKIRGLLCGNCNTGLGFFSDNPELLDLAILYLQNPPGTTALPKVSQVPMRKAQNPTAVVKP